MFRKIPRSKLEFILNNPEEYVDIFTIQNKNVFDGLINNKIHTVDESYCMFNESEYSDNIHFAYSWIKSKGKFKNYPVWGTLKSQIGKRRKDFYYDEDSTVEIKFRKKCKDILLTDYESWHCALNGCHVFDSENNNHDDIINSWNYILDVLRNPDEIYRTPVVQVCCDDIKIKDVISVKEINPKRKIYESKRNN